MKHCTRTVHRTTEHFQRRVKNLRSCRSTPTSFRIRRRICLYFFGVYAACLACVGVPSAIAQTTLLPSPVAAIYHVEAGQAVTPDFLTHGTLSLSVAANEWEATQFVLVPSTPMENLTFTVGPLQNAEGDTLAPEHVEIFQVGFVSVTVPTDYSTRPGKYPDPLLPIRGPLSLAANQAHPFWLRVYVPKNTPEGKYNGTVKIHSDTLNADLPLTVEVYPFTLPNRMSCVATFGFDPSMVFRYQKLESEEHKREVLDKYWRSFSTHHISPYNPAPLDPFVVTWPQITPGDPNVDPNILKPDIQWSNWDAAIERALNEYHFNAFVLPAPGMGGGTFYSRAEPELLGYKADTAQYRAAFTNYWRAVQDHLREKGWTSFAYTYWFDEPEPKDYDFVRAGFQRLREAAPEIGHMLTEQVTDELIGGPTIWCAVTDAFDPEKARARRKAGERIWWYVCTGPKAPYTTLFLDHPNLELRVWLWQTWKYGVQGILIWSTTWWTSDTAYPNSLQNPYEDPMSWMTGYGTPVGAKVPWGNGDGRFLYPPLEAADGNPPRPVLEGPVESIRWEMLRDGIEDYEYFCLLRALLESHRDSLSEAERETFQNLLNVPPDIARSMTEFTREPKRLLEHRDKVARAIATLQKKEKEGVTPPATSP